MYPMTNESSPVLYTPNMVHQTDPTKCYTLSKLANRVVKQASSSAPMFSNSPSRYGGSVHDMYSPPFQDGHTRTTDGTHHQVRALENIHG